MQGVFRLSGTSHFSYRASGHAPDHGNDGCSGFSPDSLMPANLFLLEYIRNSRQCQAILHRASGQPYENNCKFCSFAPKVKRPVSRRGTDLFVLSVGAPPLAKTVHRTLFSIHPPARFIGLSDLLSAESESGGTFAEKSP